jgi:hypothetical protein
MAKKYIFLVSGHSLATIFGQEQCFTESRHSTSNFNLQEHCEVQIP